jgi:hypothetical protein
MSALLRQNPRFSAGVTRPVASLVLPLLHGASEFTVFFNDERRPAMIPVNDFETVLFCTWAWTPG